ncbi:MAG: peptidylprolyl isomerase, partial [Bacteroidia bacterium]|nr:peptidylprolyl isomerase [Bacteroidia bacterium]
MKSTNIKILIILLLPLCALNIAAQSVNDPVLFTVGAAEVGLSEFDYIYSKTNGKNANYTAESIEEYLDLYIKFKLKVQEAKYIQLDTVPRLQRELETYRRQLADSYLIDKEVTEKLAREAYDRMQKDISVRHILVAVAEDADDDNVNAAYKKAMSIKAELEEGAPFPKLAVKYTDHKPSRLKGGNLGYMTAILPEGFYELERAVYSSEVNQISDPVRSKMGYHILRVEDVRPARGKIDLA